MGFFKNVFGSGSNQPEQVEQGSKKTILDYCKFDFKNIDFNSFTVIRKELTQYGNVIFEYSKKLDNNEFGLFDTLNIIRGAKHINVSFKVKKYLIDYDNLEKLINLLYSIYGKDTLNSGGRFTIEEKNALKSGGYWSGRMFDLDVCNRLQQYLVSVSEMDDDLELTIFSPDEQPEKENTKREIVSLIDKLKEINIDLDSYKGQGEPIEVPLEDELKGEIKRSMLNLQDSFFTTGLFMEYKDGSSKLFLTKENTTEREFKDYIDKLYNVLGQDWMFRKEFSLEDLKRIRKDDDVELEDFDYALRVWDCEKTNYRIAINFTEETNINMFVHKNEKPTP